MKDRYKSMGFFQLQNKFRTEKACWKYLLKTRWPNGFACSRCGHDRAGFHARRRLLQCKRCRYQASVTAGTVFHKTRTPLRTWFWFIFLMSSHKTGVSIQGLQRLLGIKSYKTAWTMAHKIRKAMADRDSNYQLAHLVEVDDSYFGGSGRGPAGRATEKKAPVLVAVENWQKKPGYLAMRVVDNLQKDHITHFAQTKIKKGHEILTDGFASYLALNDCGYELQMRLATDGENPSNRLPWVHTVIANVKSMLRGAHHGVSRKHLQRYLDEFSYRFNRRYWPSELFNRLLKATVIAQAISHEELTA